MKPRLALAMIAALTVVWPSPWVTAQESLPELIAAIKHFEKIRESATFLGVTDKGHLIAIVTDPGVMTFVGYRNVERIEVPFDKIQEMLVRGNQPYPYRDIRLTLKSGGTFDFEYGHLRTDRIMLCRSRAFLCYRVEYVFFDDVNDTLVTRAEEAGGLRRIVGLKND